MIEGSGTQYGIYIKIIFSLFYLTPRHKDKVWSQKHSQTKQEKEFKFLSQKQEDRHWVFTLIFKFCLLKDEDLFVSTKFYQIFTNGK